MRLMQKAVCVMLAVAGVIGAAEAAILPDSSITVSLEAASPSVTEGTPAELQVWLRNISGAKPITSVEIGFAAFASQLSLLSGGIYGEGFTEEAGFLSLMDFSSDRSLADGTGLGYAALFSTGIVSPSPDVLVGRFWVQTFTAGTYAIGLDDSATSILVDPAGLAPPEEYATALHGGSLMVTAVPEPGMLVSVGLIVPGLICRRRRHPKCRTSLPPTRALSPASCSHELITPETHFSLARLACGE